MGHWGTVLLLDGTEGRRRVQKGHLWKFSRMSSHNFTHKIYKRKPKIPKSTKILKYPPPTLTFGSFTNSLRMNAFASDDTFAHSSDSKLTVAYLIFSKRPSNFWYLRWEIHTHTHTYTHTHTHTHTHTPGHERVFFQTTECMWPRLCSIYRWLYHSMLRHLTSQAPYSLKREREREREREKNQLDGHIINMASPERESVCVYVCVCVCEYITYEACRHGCSFA